MTVDRSLDEFDADGTPSDGDATGETDGEATPGNGSEADGTTRDEADGDAVVSAVGTYRWDPGGAPCAACGERVERRWRDDGAYVCADCKEW